MISAYQPHGNLTAGPTPESFPPATISKGGPKQVKRQRHTPEQIIRKLRIVALASESSRRDERSPICI